MVVFEHRVNDLFSSHNAGHPGDYFIYGWLQCRRLSLFHKFSSMFLLSGCLLFVLPNSSAPIVIVRVSAVGNKMTPLASEPKLVKLVPGDFKRAGREPDVVELVIRAGSRV